MATLSMRGMSGMHVPYFTVTTTERYYRYYNGRKYYTEKRVCHFVHPTDHSQNFTDATIYTGVRSPNTLTTTRFSRVTRSCDLVRPPF